MTSFEYKVVPAPTRGVREKGVKGAPAQFALALQRIMNDLAADGWEYQRTDTLPSEERHGLTGRTTTFQNMLVFRRERVADASAPVVSRSAAPPVGPATPDVAPPASGGPDEDAAARVRRLFRRGEEPAGDGNRDGKPKDDVAAQ